MDAFERRKLTAVANVEQVEAISTHKDYAKSDNYPRYVLLV